jgi:DNA-binding NarL/FixJ family response regulator
LPIFFALILNGTQVIITIRIGNAIDRHAHKKVGQPYRSGDPELATPMPRGLCASKMEGLTYEEVAQKLGVSINTVRTQITRAMKKMRIALARFL